MAKNCRRSLILEPLGADGLPDFYEVVMMLDDIRIVLERMLKRKPTYEEVAEHLCGPKLVELRKGLLALEEERRKEVKRKGKI